MSEEVLRETYIGQLKSIIWQVAMSEEVLRETLAHLKTQPKEIILSGGEPTIFPDNLKNILEILRTRFPEARISLQTNATLLSSTLISLIHHFGLGVGVSIDGPPEINESLRGKTGSVMAGLKLLAQEALGCGVTVTVNRDNASFLKEVILFLAQFPAVRSVGLDLLRPVDRANLALLPSTASLKAGLEGLKEAFSWLKSRGHHLILRETRSLSSSLAYCPAARGASWVVTPEGEIYPCASLIGHKKYRLGSIWGEEIRVEGLPSACLAEATTGATDGIDYVEGLPSACLACPNKKFCPGRCPSRAILAPLAARLDCLLRECLLFKVPAWGQTLQKEALV